MKRRQQFNPNKPETVPPNVAGIDWRNLRKGDVITSEQILDMFNIIWDEREVVLAPQCSLKSCMRMQVKEWLEKIRLSIAKPLLFSQKNDDLHVLTDEQAVGYLNGQAYQGLKKHRKATSRMFTHIDTDNLTQHQKDQLSVNQARHAMIASAADGARRQAIQIQRKGGELPRIIPPNL